MWPVLITVCYLPFTISKYIGTKGSPLQTMFTEKQIIFSSSLNITKLLVPVDGKFIHANDILPSIFFTVTDPKLDGGTCIYVLEGLFAYEVLEGGRDSTAGYEKDAQVYFGAKDGLYKYNPQTLSAKRFGIWKDDIIQLQKANGSDVIYILTANHKLYKIEKGATIRSRIKSIICALEFVLDTSNNIYYINCKDQMIHIVTNNSNLQPVTANAMQVFKWTKLLRPAFIMDDCVPVFGDGNLFVLYSNGTCEKKDFFIREKPSAISVDAALYLAVALDGKIYEFNIVEVLLKSMFGLLDGWPRDVTKTIASVMESAGSVSKDVIAEDTLLFLDSNH